MAESKSTMTLTDSQFENEIVKSGQLSLVDFWAEWCGPCRILGPTIDRIAEEFQGRLKVYKMNVDENPGTPSKFHIRGIPTVLLFKNGQLVEQLVGNQPKDALVQMIQRHL